MTDGATTCPACGQGIFLWFVEQNGKCPHCEAALILKQGKLEEVLDVGFV